MCRDGVGRFWSPTDIKMPYRLYMCAVIDPSQSLVTSDSSASICSSHHNSIDDENNNNNHDHYEDSFSPIHYIGCDELQNALNVYQLHQSVSKHSESISQQIEKVKEMVKDTPDLLFRIQLDGSIIFWGIQVIYLIFYNGIYFFTHSCIFFFSYTTFLYSILIHGHVEFQDHL